MRILIFFDIPVLQNQTFLVSFNERENNKYETNEKRLTMINKKFIQSIAAAAIVSFCTTQSSAQPVVPDQWAATDALGRKVREYRDAGDKKQDKFVAIFYWTWHQGDDDKTYPVKNITEIVRKYPEAMKDYHHPAWGNKQPGFFFWEQPLLGYYKTTDPWVLRKHAEMLADAGVDAVFFDCTNGDITWKDSYEALLKTWDQAQKRRGKYT